MTSLLVRDPLFTQPFRLMDEFFTRAFGNGQRVTGWVPKADVHEEDHHYLVWIDLPGVKSDDVSIEVSDQVLSVSGTRVPLGNGETQWLERPYGSFVRTFTLPKGVDGDEITADYTDGVLTLHIPKPADALPKKIAIGGSSQKAIER